MHSFPRMSSLAPLLAYHADAEIERVRSIVLLGCAAAAAIAIFMVARRLPRGTGRVSRTAVGAAAMAVVSLFLTWAFVFIGLPAVVAAVVLGVSAVRELPERGEKWTALAALTLSLAVAVFVFAAFVACAVTGACLH